MKKLFLLMMVILWGCDDVPDPNDNPVGYQQYNYKKYYTRCTDLYKEALTHTDSLIVHAVRPADVYHNSPTCLELNKLYADSTIVKTVYFGTSRDYDEQGRRRGKK